MGHSDLTIEQVQAEAPGWRVWRTRDAGTWWASRMVDCLTEPRTLAADTGQELLDLLRKTAAEASANAPTPGGVAL